LKLKLVLFLKKELYKHYDRTNGRTHTAIYFCPVAYRLLRNIRNVGLQSQCLATNSTLSNGRMIYKTRGTQTCKILTLKRTRNIFLQIILKRYISFLTAKKNINHYSVITITISMAFCP